MSSFHSFFLVLSESILWENAFSHRIRRPFPCFSESILRENVFYGFRPTRSYGTHRSREDSVQKRKICAQDLTSPKKREEIIHEEIIHEEIIHIHTYNASW